MDGVVVGGHRRIDRVLAPDYLRGVEVLPMGEVRARAAEADQEETDLSYLRRLLQARIDLVVGELDRRSRGGSVPTDVVAYLVRVLSDAEPPPPRQSGRRPRPEPTRVGDTRRWVEQLVSDALLTDLPGADEAELTTAHDILVTNEQTVSSQRAAVQDVLDALHAEIGRRYRNGEASVDALLQS